MNMVVTHAPGMRMPSMTGMRTRMGILLRPAVKFVASETWRSVHITAIYGQPNYRLSL